MGFLILALAFLPAGLVAASALDDAEAIPHLGERGRADYREFLTSPEHRVFVIAPGGTWAWNSGIEDEGEAVDTALSECQQHTAQECVPYTVDDRVVFDAARWTTLWGPYYTRTHAAARPVGTRRGERFPDLAFRGADGRAMKLSDLRGRVVVLHFWGSWCRPCQREMPDLQHLHDAVRNDAGIAVVLLPVRERFAQARRWADQLGVRLPIYDSGLKGEDDDQLPLAGGGRIPDRQIAKIFPTTYVLDRHGVVVFSHVGAASRWVEYVPFLRDAAAKSGR